MKDVVQKSRKRTYTNTKRLRRLNERKLTPKVNEFMRYMRKQLQRGLTRVRARKPKTFVEQLADWDAIIEEGQRILKPELLKILAEGGKAVVERKIIKQEAEPRFDILGIPAVKWAEKHTAKLVTEVIEETKQAIRQEVKAGIDYGKSIQKIAKELRPIVGLTSRQAGAVAKYRILLEEQALPQQKIASLVERYANRLHKFRTQMIARTETASALSEGTLQGFEQIGIKRVRGVADEEACEYCLENIDGKVYTIDEASGLIPAHPQCLPGNSLVLPNSKITGFSRRWYEGYMVTIYTESGKSLSATPNHPILNEEGWIPISDLNLGDYVYCKDENRDPKQISIGKIVESVFKKKKLIIIPQKQNWFHGDGTEGKMLFIYHSPNSPKRSKQKRKKLSRADIIRQEGLIKDRIVNKEWVGFAGHVYNLETEGNYYIANGIASHNCECAWVAES